MKNPQESEDKTALKVHKDLIVNIPAWQEYHRGGLYMEILI